MMIRFGPFGSCAMTCSAATRIPTPLHGMIWNARRSLLSSNCGDPRERSCRLIIPRPWVVGSAGGVVVTTVRGKKQGCHWDHHDLVADKNTATVTLEDSSSVDRTRTKSIMSTFQRLGTIVTMQVASAGHVDWSLFNVQRQKRTKSHHTNLRI